MESRFGHGELHQSVKLAMASKCGHGELHSVATHDFCVPSIQGLSGRFQTDSFDVIKCI